MRIPVAFLILVFLVAGFAVQSVFAANAVTTRAAQGTTLATETETALVSADPELWDDLDREIVGAYAAPPGTVLAPKGLVLDETTVDETAEDAERQGSVPGVEPREVLDIQSPDSLTVLVNKRTPVNPEKWEPDDLQKPLGVPNPWDHTLRAPAATALEQMYAEAVDAGLNFKITSGFRSFETQDGLYADYAARFGDSEAKTFSAQAGYSEHQTGLAVDLDDDAGCYLAACFGETVTGQWLAENAHRFGFILRYENGQEAITGYGYEPWHFRYVGPDVAHAYWESDATSLEVFLDQEPAPTY